MAGLDGHAPVSLSDPANGFYYTASVFSDEAFELLKHKGRTPLDPRVVPREAAIDLPFLPTHPVARQEMVNFYQSQYYFDPNKTWMEVLTLTMNTLRHVCFHTVDSSIANNAMLKKGSSINRYSQDVIPPLVSCIVYNHAFGSFRWSQTTRDVAFEERAKMSLENQTAYFLFARPVLYYASRFLDVNQVVDPATILSSGTMHQEKSLIRRFNKGGVWSQELIYDKLMKQNGESINFADKHACKGVEYPHARVLVLFAPGLKMDANKRLYMRPPQIALFGTARGDNPMPAKEA